MVLSFTRLIVGGRSMRNQRAHTFAAVTWPSVCLLPRLGKSARTMRRGLTA